MSTLSQRRAARARPKSDIGILRHVDRDTAEGLRAIAQREGRSVADTLRCLVENDVGTAARPHGTAKPTKLLKKQPNLPALAAAENTVLIRAGIVFGNRKFTRAMLVKAPTGGYVAGTDYGVVVDRKSVTAIALPDVTAISADMIGGFHFAAGGNAPAAGGGGGDDKPSVNPHSLWDLKFRPACPDPRGMTCVELPSGKRFWCDIYLTGVNHLTEGTSKFGAVIADGADLPCKPTAAGKSGGSLFERFNYDAACEIMKHHGKSLMSVEEFFAAAIGVTEKSAAKSNPKVTALDAPRTSRWGLMQATGNMYVWGHDGHPDVPRASIFGGSWLDGDDAGSRHADVAYNWPVNSGVNLGARGRSDHLQLA